MKKKFLCRLAAVGTTALVAVGSVAMLAGCTTSNNPEVTITYSFNGQDYEVEYILSRSDAPKTVQHFIELADSGFYEGIIVHDYDKDDYTFSAGGYRLVNGELEEVDYLSTVRQLEQDKNMTFSQSVWADQDRTQPLYSVYGEFSKNGVEQEYGKEYVHKAGALVMYYTPKHAASAPDQQVWVQRADGGDKNDGIEYQQLGYEYNSTTSLFYTFTGESRVAADATYTVIGMAKDYSGQLANGLMKAVDDYIAGLGEDEEFVTEINNYSLNRYDHFSDVQKAGITDSFKTPVNEPITIKSVKVTKY